MFADPWLLPGGRAPVVAAIAAGTGHGAALAVFPLAAAAIAAAFGGSLARQFAGRRRAFQGLWTAALLMFAVASLAMFLGVVGGWSSAEYRVYWLFGAILNVPYLAMGEISLLARRRWVILASGAVLVAITVLSVVQVLRARLHPAALARTLPLGKNAFVDHGPLGAYHLANWCGNGAYAVLLAGIAWSAWQMRGRRDLRDRMVGTIVIAAGATVVAIGSGIGAGFDVVPLFSVGLAAGVAVMFAGFLRVGRTPSTAPPSSSGP